MLGLTVAYRLAQRGQEVTLFEAADEIGGLAGAWTLGNVTWDRHYHVTLLSDRRLLRLLEDLGLEDELRFTQTRTGFSVDGRLYSLSNSWDFLRFKPLGWWAKARLAATILWASRMADGRKLEHCTVEEWLCKWSGRRTFDRIWRPLLLAKLGEHYRRTSAAFIWATIARMYAARRSGLKREMFGYVSGGYARVLSRFGDVLRQAGARIKTRAAVEQVFIGADGGLTVREHGGRDEAFDQVVVTVPAPVAARMCPQWSEDERSRLNGVEYLGIICPSVLLKRPLTPYYVMNVTEPFVPFTGVIEMSALAAAEELSGHGLIYLPKYVAADDPLWNASDEQIRCMFLGGLAQLNGRFREEDVLAFQVSRVKHVFALSTLGYSNRVPRQETTLPGVHLVSSCQITNGTLNVNETVGLAEEAIPHLLSRAGCLV
jgi:protoporphyrinogen oxidase